MPELTKGTRGVLSVVDNETRILDMIVGGGYGIAPSEESNIYRNIVLAASDMDLNLFDIDEPNFLSFVEEYKERIFPGVNIDLYISEGEY
jgi:hypothetical protein